MINFNDLIKKSNEQQTLRNYNFYYNSDGTLKTKQDRAFYETGQVSAIKTRVPMKEIVLESRPDGDRVDELTGTPVYTLFGVCKGMNGEELVALKYNKKDETAKAGDVLSPDEVEGRWLARGGEGRADLYLFKKSAEHIVK